MSDKKKKVDGLKLEREIEKIRARQRRAERHRRYRKYRKRGD